MPTSTSRLAYSDCLSLMDAALEDSSGIRVKCPDAGRAWYLRLRMNKARAVVRQENARDYERDHPMHGRSVYDVIVITIENDEQAIWVKLQKVDAIEFEIQSLGGGE